jgi:hypothetical protein
LCTPLQIRSAKVLPPRITHAARSETNELTC